MLTNSIYANEASTKEKKTAQPPGKKSQILSDDTGWS